MSLPVAEAVVLTAIGMRTPVGNDAIESAASVRAGINRFALWEAHGTAFDEAAGLTASCLPDNLGDEAWVGKAIELVPQAIHEALWSGGLLDFSEVRARNPDARVGAYIATPYRDRPGVSDEAFRMFAVEAREHCIAPARADSVQLFSCDNAAGITAVARAADDLRAGKVDFAVVGAVDSLLHGEYLRTLAGEGRLKLPSQGGGLIPGEAGAVVVLERARDARRRGAPTLAELGEASVEREPTPIGPEHPIRAEGASRAVLAALERNAGRPPLDRVLVDLNGERWRSLEWALVETRCLGGVPPGWLLWNPADCLGDVGAATSIVHICLAARAFARGYGGRAILVSAASWRGERAALPIYRAGGIA